MRKASFYTLGCRLNQTESALIAHGLKAKGYEVTLEKENTDLCVINTCTVTGMSDQKCRQMIRQVQKANPAAIIAVVGCYSQMASEEILEIGGVHLVLGTQEKLKLPEYLAQVDLAGEPVIAVGAIDKTSFTIDAETQHRGLTRANIKVQDGCDFLCSFCIIPQARGRSRSRVLSDCVGETKNLVAADVKELVLTGVNLGCYAEGEHQFIDLINQLSATGIQRLRISSIEPTTVGTEVFELMAASDHPLVPHLHLPLQSGSDRILKAMRRKYDGQGYLDYLNSALKAVPNLGVGTDVIVGFPGETDQEFQETYDLLDTSGVQYFHVFPYALRPGTRAAQLPEQLPPQLIQERALALRELGDKKRAQFAAQAVGQVHSVLFEHSKSGGTYHGYTNHYLRVQTQSAADLGNQIHQVKITGTQGHLGLGELCG